MWCRCVRALLNSFKLGRTVLFIAGQSWYYVNIYNIADNNMADVGCTNRIGCFGAMLRNEKEEMRVAAGLVGVDCVGTSYGGLNGQSGVATMTKVTLLICALLSVLIGTMFGEPLKMFF